jgi:hypothetical protein
MITGLVFVAAVVAVVVWPRKREPEYQGKKLSEWLEIYERNSLVLQVGYGKSGDSTTKVKRMEEARDAIKQIGTNGVPFLLQWIAYEPKPPTQTSWLERHQLRFPFSFSRSYKDQSPIPRHILAAEGFLIVGTDASGCLPKLAILHSRKGTQTSMAAGRVLAFFGYDGDAVPVLTRALSDADPRIRVEATNAVYKIAPWVLTNRTSGG